MKVKSFHFWVYGVNGCAPMRGKEFSADTGILPAELNEWLLCLLKEAEVWPVFRVKTWWCASSVQMLRCFLGVFVLEWMIGRGSKWKCVRCGTEEEEGGPPSSVDRPFVWRQWTLPCTPPLPGSSFGDIRLKRLMLLPSTSSSSLPIYPLFRLLVRHNLSPIVFVSSVPVDQVSRLISRNWK